MLSSAAFIQRLKQQLPFQLTRSQEVAVQGLASFMCDPSDHQVFVLNGYAGTGKTTLVSAMVKTLRSFKMPTVLLAPTGRSAKVFSLYASHRAYTIHKCLYYSSVKDGEHLFTRRRNTLSHTLFIVDEASMIADTALDAPLLGQVSLMQDLFSFVQEGEGCKLLLVGDAAQLPPVNYEESPALDTSYIQSNFCCSLSAASLVEVTRQTQNSGILYNASLLRSQITRYKMNFPIFSSLPFDDFRRVRGEELEELLHSLYGRYDAHEIVVITHSNKRAYLYNQEIRHRILYRETELSAGDYVLAVKNNYFWIQDDADVGFLANGDTMEILSIHKRQSLYGFHFADVTVRLCDYPDHDPIDVKIILESLDSDQASLSREQWQQLYLAVSEDYADIPTKKERLQKMKVDPFLNAVQVKFAYAMTCHKTQGGQWPCVLLDPGYLPDGKLTETYGRWLYTAVTRATQHLFLINFNDIFFDTNYDARDQE